MTTADNELVIVREFDAPRDLLFRVWTEPRHIENWWGPRGFSTRVTGVDLRVGGKWNYVMIGPDGSEYPVNGVFSEIVPPEKIVTSDEFGEGDYDALNTELPRGITMTAIFEDLGSRSRLTLRISHQSVEDRKKHEGMGVVAGWQSSFDRMDEYLPGLREIDEVNV